MGDIAGLNGDGLNGDGLNGDGLNGDDLNGDAQPVFYMAAHAGLGLMESAMPFIERGAKVFVYKWNPHSAEIRDYFLKTNPNRVVTFEMSLTTLLEEIEAEEKEIVLLMTASPTYEFGAAQLKLFQLLRGHFPTKIVDIYKVGHCMYGCTSHAHDDACNFPVSYSRYVRKSLPYDAQSVLTKYFDDESRINDHKATKIFVCPSYSWRDTTYAKTSLLSNISAIDVLKELHDDQSAKICVKFHPICYSYAHLYEDAVAEAFSTAASQTTSSDSEEAPLLTSSSEHPFLSIPPQDEAGLGRLMRSMPVVPPEETSALPFLESCDVAVVDLFSSMTFESLFFHPSIHVLAFGGEDIPQFTPDPQILELVHLFRNGDELKHLLTLAAEGKLENKRLSDGRTGREFFKEKYQEPDGKEAIKVGRIRKWTGYGGAVEEKNAVVNGDSKSRLTDETLDREYQDCIVFPTKLEMMVTGKSRAEVEADILENPVRRFVEDHRLQLRTMRLPKTLWQTLFVKIHREIYDAGDKFQIQMMVEEEEEEEVTTTMTPSYQVVALEDLEPNSDLFLVDHAMTWTDDREARLALAQNRGLMHRIEALVGVEVEKEKEEEEEEKEEVDRVEKLMNLIWQKAEGYSSLSPGGIQQTINFLNDEFGSKIRRWKDEDNDDDNDDDDRNVKFEVFFFLYQGIAFSVFWPAKRIEEDEEVVR